MLHRNYQRRMRRSLRRTIRQFAWKVGTRLFKTVTVATVHGRLTVFTSDQAIGRRLYLRREFESNWTAAALAFLRDAGRLPPQGQGTVLDIGANMGVISIGLLHNSEFEKAIAIEPDPRNFELLQHNARQNHLSADRYICLPYAASDHQGEAEFELSQDNFGDHRIRTDSEARRYGQGGGERYRESTRRTIRVETDSLDHLLAGLPAGITGDVAAVWIDTQGHEAMVFNGGKQLFSKDIPVVCEIWPYGIKRSGIDRRKFYEIAAGLWGDYWVRQGNEFVRRPIAALNTLFEELGDDGDFDNVIFTK